MAPSQTAWKVSMHKASALVLIFVSAASACMATAAATTEDSPAWAYPVNPPDFKPVADDGSIRRVPDSTSGLTLSQARDPFFAPDWHPEDHAQMPAVVASGLKPNAFACGFCHRAEGTGGPENASLAGLPVAYIIQQMADYRSGARSTALASRAPQAFMIRTAKAVSDEDVRAAALYFSALKPKLNINVVESDLAPTTYVAGWFLAASVPSGQEPLGQRIVEMPNDLHRFESRDTRVTFTAYVPPGSLKAGRNLVAGQDSNKTPACATCHGQDLRGVDAIPSIAGRSPTYVFRQLHEFKIGIRAGSSAGLMKDTVARLDQGDMIAIAAYLATLKP
jgi:cytochrome c553